MSNLIQKLQNSKVLHKSLLRSQDSQARFTSHATVPGSKNNKVAKVKQINQTAWNS